MSISVLLFYRTEPSRGTITSKRDAAEQVHPYKYSQLESSFGEAPVYHNSSLNPLQRSSKPRRPVFPSLPDS